MACKPYMPGHPHVPGNISSYIYIVIQITYNTDTNWL